MASPGRSLSPPQQKNDIKKSIRGVMALSLQPDSAMQRIAEERKRALEVIPEYPAILLDIIANEEESIADRQMASILLKSYFAFTYDKKIFMKTYKIKEEICFRMVHLLETEITLIKANVSLALVGMLEQEDQYFYRICSKKIQESLQSNKISKICGALCFIKDLLINDQEFGHTFLSIEYFQLLQQVLHNKSFPTDIRALSLSCIVYLVQSLDDGTELFTPILIELGTVIKNTLTSAYSPENDFRLKSSVVGDLGYIAEHFQHRAASIIEACLPILGTVTILCSNEFKQVVGHNSPLPKDAHESENAEYFTLLILNILHTIDLILDIEPLTPLLYHSRVDILYHMVIFTCMYEDCKLFYSNDERDIILKVREQSIYTLMHFIRSHDVNVMFESLHVVLQRISADIADAQQQCYLLHVRLLEAVMYVMGNLPDYAPQSMLDAPPDSFSFIYYIEQWSQNLTMNCTSTNWIVIVRLIWLGSKFSTMLSKELLELHMRTIVAHCSSDNEQLRIACAHAIRNHLRANYMYDKPEFMMSKIGVILECVFNVIDRTHVVASIYLEALAYFSEYFPDQITSSLDRIIDLMKKTLAVHFLEYSIIKQLTFLLSRLCKISAIKHHLIAHFLPTVVRLIYRNPPPAICLRQDAPEQGIELYNIFVMYLELPVPDTFIIEGFHGISMLLISESDQNTNEVATTCLTNMVLKFSDKLKVLNGANEKVLFNLIPEIIFKVLGPQATTCTAKFGRLFVVSLMCFSNELHSSMEAILKSLLSFLQRAEHPKTIQNLCTIFVFVFMYQPSNILNFLTSIPGPDGGSALCYFFQKWKFHHLMHLERFEKNIMTMSICKMIEYSLMERDDRINEIRVPDPKCPTRIEFSGLEYLYYLLIMVAYSELKDCQFSATETDPSEDDHEEDYNAEPDVLSKEEDMLIKNHQFYQMNILQECREFLYRINTVHYTRAVKYHLKPEIFDSLVRYNIAHSNFIL